jgi:hypothetical protein
VSGFILQLGILKERTKNKRAALRGPFSLAQPEKR